eukprot:CAMPEP_0174236980 /NCGR_PEP_ID=MMETSP0417-20130205/6368_1 /TAXON_ID=242541 /ORGANISM="Mayorella sp, Strain BSH-02190019" /LENGTH=202 /DNA_ID=CAMNT_0015315685 /DNA_START=98 /DNA_END=706 /DNA_ORIENTATION=-
MAARKKILLKILVLGDSGVGKTSLLVRYVEDKFTMATKSTIGANFLTKQIEVDGKDITMQIWDTAGQERFQGLGTAFYRGSDGVIFVFDVTRRDTFEELERWRTSFLIQVEQEGNNDFPMLIIGNKCDKADERVVSKQELVEFCNKYGLEYFEASAKDSINVEESFERVASLVVSNLKPEEFKYGTLDMDKDDGKKGDSCCS